MNYNQFCTFMPFGRTGVGKSTFLNCISGTNYFKTSPYAKSCTKDVSSYQVQVDEKTLISIDPPGIFDSEGTDEDQINMKNLIDILRNNKYGLNGIGIVIACSEYRLDKITQKLLKLLNQIIRNDNLWSRLCVIVTHCPPYSEDLEELKKSMTSGNNCLKAQIIRLIKGISQVDEDPLIPFFFVDSKHPKCSPFDKTISQFKKWLFELSPISTYFLNEPDLKYQLKIERIQTEKTPLEMLPIYKWVREETKYYYNGRTIEEPGDLKKMIKGYYQEIKYIEKTWIACWDYDIDIIDENNPTNETNYEYTNYSKVRYFDDQKNELSFWSNREKIWELEKLMPIDISKFRKDSQCLLI